MTTRLSTTCLLFFIIAIVPLTASEADQSTSSALVWWVAFIKYAARIAITIVVGTVIWLVLKNLLNQLFVRTQMVPVFAAFVQRALRWAMILIITLAVIQQIGVELGILWGMISAGVAMVAIGFVAVWSVLSNTTAAFILLMARPFRIGDLVEVTEATGGNALKGTLTDVSLVYTTIEELGEDGTTQHVRIPNNVLLQKTIRVIPARDGVDIGTHLSAELMDKPAVDPTQPEAAAPADQTPPAL